MDLTQDMGVQMGMKVSPRLVQASYILELSSMELQQAIAEELSENPAIELVEQPTCSACGTVLEGSICPNCLSQQKLPLTSMDGDDGGDDYVPEMRLAAAIEDDFDPLTQVAAQLTLAERLLNELQTMLPAEDMPIAQFLVGNLDESGYLQCSTEEVIDRFGVPAERVEIVLTALQSLEPVGVGARDLRECLLLQLDYLESEGIVCPYAREIITHHLPELAEHKYSRIASHLGITHAEVETASDFIRHRLNPFPSQGDTIREPGVSDSRSTYVLPDVVINCGQTGFEIEVIESKRFTLRVTPLYNQLAANLEREPDRFSDDEKRHIKQYVSRAKLFIANINQRRQTLQKITEYIASVQSDFLLQGIRHLRALTRAAVALALGMHESTVSRATASKFVMLPNKKVIPFSDFFTASLSVMDVIKELIANEKRPLTDQEIADELGRRHIPLARRTVAKYREQLNILPSSLR
ncbi:MAG: RNA polymerase factor sigma-54 [Chloroflexi bacterium]|nr:RNA polymerase factor sigma-54 [Chloroflexota bacterium]